MHDLPLGQICRLRGSARSWRCGVKPCCVTNFKRLWMMGVTAETLRETILQTYLFAGYASAINAFIVLNELGVKGRICAKGSGPG